MLWRSILELYILFHDPIPLSSIPVSHSLLVQVCKALHFVYEAPLTVQSLASNADPEEVKRVGR